MARGRHRSITATVALTLATTVAACGHPRPDRQSHDPTGPVGRWTLPLTPGEHRVAVVGAVAVVTDRPALVGVDVATGRQRWRREATGPYTATVAGGLIVQVTSDGTLAVVDPATGADRWQDIRIGWRFVVRADTVYADNCAAQAEAGQTGCTVEAHELTDGGTRWTLDGARAGVRDDRIGSREPVAPTSGPYVLVGTGDPARPYGAVDSRTGRARDGHVATGWQAFAVDDVLVSTDAGPAGRCAVTITAVTADTGARRWSDTFSTGRRHDGGCRDRLADPHTGAALVGTGHRVAVVDTHDATRLVDLTSGRTVWAADGPGVPLDGDDRSLLVRRHADAGPLRLLESATGRTRWSAPDPGLTGQFVTVVTGRVVAVGAAVGDDPLALVHDAATGRELGRYQGRLVGAGDDWVAVTRDDGPDRVRLEFVRL